MLESQSYSLAHAQHLLAVDRWTLRQCLLLPLQARSVPRGCITASESTHDFIMTLLLLHISLSKALDTIGAQIITSHNFFFVFR